MNDILKDRLKTLADDRITLKAVEAVFDEVIEKELPTIDKLEPNEVIGEKYRAYIQAKRIIKQTLVDIGSYKDGKVEKINYNKGR